MKALSALVLLAAASLVVAGCGSGGRGSEGKVVAGSVTVAGTTTISNVKAGTRISCDGGRPTVTVPEWPGNVAAVSGPSTSKLRLTRSQGRTIVSCTR